MTISKKSHDRGCERPSQIGERERSAGGFETELLYLALRAKADYNIDEWFRRSEAQTGTRQVQEIFALAGEIEGISTFS
ncbi:MAG: hypothetical protein OXC08_05085 [Thiotrichales bacterium]|nr:hypothetical protein [Thiotrichales bacterium]